MNRGSEVDEHVRVRPKDASMRPRFMNRGSARGTSLHARRPARFNEAPIHESGKSA